MAPPGFHVQGSTSARFYLSPKGTGIVMVPPPDARSREMYNTENHNYVNTEPNGSEKTGNYPGGPPPGMMAKLAPFVQAAVKAIDHAKQTPDGAKWDDQYFRNILQHTIRFPRRTRDKLLAFR